MADLNILRASCLLRSSIDTRASYMIRSAVDFLPRIIMMLTNFATNRLPYLGSGKTSRFAAPARLIALCRPALDGLGAVLRAALLAAGDPRGVEGAADDVIADTRQILHASAADHDDRVLLQVVADPRDVRGDLEPVRQPYPRDFPESGVRLLRRRRVHADADTPLLGTPLHRGRLRLPPHRLATLMDQLIDSRHGSPPPYRRQNSHVITETPCHVNDLAATRPPPRTRPRRPYRRPAVSARARCPATSRPHHPASAPRPACSSRVRCPPESGGRRSRSPSGRGDEAVGRERRLGDTQEHRLGRRGALTLRQDPIVLLLEDELVDQLADHELCVAHLFDAHPSEHLADDDLDVLVVDGHALQAIDLLHLVDQVTLQLAIAAHRQIVVRVGRPVHEALARSRPIG